MIKLIDLINEANLPKDSNLLKMINRDKPKDKPPYAYLDVVYNQSTFPVTPAYDFGGYEEPLEGNEITIIDVQPDKFNEFEDNKYIQADLSKYTPLPPRKGIYMGHSLAYIENYPIISKTINDALQSGGILIIIDWYNPINKILPYLQSYKLLEVSISNNDLKDANVAVVLKKQ
jgi:hypothetical protein